MEEEKVRRTFKEKMLFYTTTFFVLLGIFSAFGFLFLVPFVIDPAFTTIFMEFDEMPALCVTASIDSRMGTSNCSWTSCREGCTKELFTCTQIRVNYKMLPEHVARNHTLLQAYMTRVNTPDFKEVVVARKGPRLHERALRDYDYREETADEDSSDAAAASSARDDINLYDEFDEDANDDLSETTGLMGNESEWYFTGARLFPNVKGCGYPPMLNCTIFIKRYRTIGTNFTCYYSKIDPGIVITELDIELTYRNLILALGIPIPSFIASVIYLAFAYFKIYNDDDEKALLPENGDELDADADDMDEQLVDLDSELLNNNNTKQSHDQATPIGSGMITPASDMCNSFGHQYEVQMVDDMSHDSLTNGVSSLRNSMSIIE